ncbi:MAG TPA: lipopolysaccharide kinase InaA family protein [Planctomycetota bacterium]|nr:hypothetical protein [Planctomycetota bacterium]MDP6128102.1 lipopolysaccharide kinase InaA family protein [Planctomycetota bacterium]MDP7246346.1 lipopolysaccharide kinase InaA family protein [Planctomycetota bacterium]MDP7559329.1 lipopolysaccharide kinase InaA family protein [Planctomycetota bacterium]HJM38567.1 lipopolysaccharide kinase InaA family protein [Planctomycetota bacterium]
MSAPSTFESHSSSGVLLWVRRGIELPGGVDNWQHRGQERLESLAGDVCGAGRGAVRKLPLGERHGIWRRNLHGGFFGALLGDRFLDAERLTEEVVVSETLRAQGVATPKVLLAYAERKGLFWQQHLVTEEVQSAQTIYEARKSPAAIAEAMKLLESLFDLGFWAADMHPANLLWQPESSQCWLIDLAVSSFLGRPLNPMERAARLQRFRRYFQKHAGSIPEGVSLPPNR